MHNSQVNTIAALAVIFVFGIAGTTLIIRAIHQVDWSLVDAADTSAFIAQ